MDLKRSAGVLLHISSLPSKYGIGTLGKTAYDFMDWLEQSNLHLWQILPLVPTNYGDSPYQSVSSTALNYYFIDLDILNQKGLLEKDEYTSIFWESMPQRVDYACLFKNRVPILKKAFARFNQHDPHFEKFVAEEKFDDFAIFMTLKEMHHYQAWYLWEEKYRHYSESLEKEIRNFHATEYLFWVWTQYEFLQEWEKLHAYAKQKGIQIMGDMPLYVAYDSVEVWKYPELFILKENHELKLIAGCPPDAFSADGQLWGNPIYDWEAMKKNNYAWWQMRMHRLLELFDILRLDHFRGFDRYYVIPANEKTAKNGWWQEGPKFDFFKDKLQDPIVVEDLGYIDEGVRTLKKQTNFPGMKVLSFAFDGFPDNEHKPSNYEENCIVYTGTHDNMPLYQYFTELTLEQFHNVASEIENECCKFNIAIKEPTPYHLVERVVELAFASKAKVCIIPMQDLLFKGKEARMNFPSTVSNLNWSYRMAKEELSSSLSSRLQEYCRKYQRTIDPKVK